ncbi:MAG: tRNA pseudouridine(38-40) synthase TruA [Deltaproteobacteria bacterium HGW-Deltaproteobacteria-24]|nr:MAG: tRNA pseudouridine(38-40) synthase TruA [Deltaproteobacteria bacterium HGW-Deltaproteobacteria-24]
MNVKITIAYDGFEFNGSQTQPEKNAVEDRLIEAFSRLNVEAKIILSGRTDKGVHATGQVFNVQLPEHFNQPIQLKKLLNHQLPLSIRVLKAQKVPLDFHARFSAKKRVYRYFITQKPITPFNARYVTYVEKIDVQKIKEAIACFVGVHDFEYFHKMGSDKHHFFKEIFEAKFYAYKENYVFKFKANSYLRSQIRLMVGFLLDISSGKRTIKELQEQLAKKKRIHFKPVDGFGLYLAKVIY